jgi:hypothetical protein
MQKKIKFIEKSNMIQQSKADISMIKKIESQNRNWKNIDQ